MKRRDILRRIALAPLAGIAAPGIGLGALPTTESSNAVDWYREAIAGLSLEGDATASLLRNLTSARLDRVAARLVERHARPLALLARGAEATSCDWGDAWTGPRFESLLWMKGTNLARLALLRARFAFEVGQVGHGFDDVLAAIGIARHLTLGGVFIAQLYGFAIEHAAIEVAASALPSLGPIGVVEFRDWFEAMPRNPTPAEAVQGERAFFLGYCRAEYPDRYDEAETARQLPVYDRIVDLLHRGDEAGLAALRGELAEGADGEGSSFLDSLDAFRRAVRYLGVRRAMLDAALVGVARGVDAARLVVDPTDGLPFGLRSWSGGFLLTSRFALDGKPPASLRVGRA